jgi:HK97 family phage prohead protease
MSKSFNSYSVKSHDLQVKDLDMANRKVAVYLSTFDQMDSDFDIIRRGSFSKSIFERGPQSTSNRKIAFLRYHNWELPIGKFIELSEDEKGLFAIGELGNSTAGNDALNDYKDGIIREHSIGFRYVKDKLRFIEDSTMESGGYYEISEVMLWEGSAVTFGANEFTNVVEVAKSADKNLIKEKATQISANIDLIGRALASGQGSDDRLHALEMQLKYLNSQFMTLLDAEPLTKHSVVIEPPLTLDWEKVINNVKF